MDKKTQMILGVGVLAVAGYLIYKGMQPKNLVGAAGPVLSTGGTGTMESIPRLNISSSSLAAKEQCCGHSGTFKTNDGKDGYTCCNGSLSAKSQGNPCSQCGKKKTVAAEF
jgi:hypothetical protein